MWSTLHAAWTTCFDHAAGNLLAGVTSRLRGEVIGARMYDHGFADDLAYGKAGGQKHLERIAVISEQRRQVSRVLGMGTAVRIIVGQGVRKWIALVPAASAAAVDMEGEDTLSALLRRCGEPGYLGGYKDAASRLIKSHAACKIGILGAPAYPCCRMGALAERCGKVIKMPPACSVSGHTLNPSTTLLIRHDMRNERKW